jgi:hypothetical protein
VKIYFETVNDWFNSGASYDFFMILESNKKRNNLLGSVVLALGILFISLTSKVENPNQNEKAALLLGFLLAAVGGLALLVQEERKTELQPDKKRMIFSYKTLFTAQKKEIIPYEQIEFVGVTSIGTRSPNRIPSYIIYIKLKNGKKIRTGYVSFAEYETKELAAQMAGLIGCQHSPTPIPPLETELIENAILAAILSAVTWAIIYRLKIGAWNSYMWFSRGALLFMLGDFLGMYYFLMIVRRKYKS